MIALGANLGDRRRTILRAIHELRHVLRVVCVSRLHETAPVDAPAGSPAFLNCVVTGFTRLDAHALLDRLLEIERRLGRVRRERNAPRTIDLDLILFGAHRIRTRALTLPHPRAHAREFILRPLQECGGLGRDLLRAE
ncbi:MAG TPA: 2-amino-4-hydroxy-6-hydroxymethyldihydropteridine diphosphokinase [Thermoanaerobaculia bacterium]|nr:2-amino-4-hydroxy-6-hydroxymethyldihydropteridine diphosphokinase [Thermoanaerobaculia bacterium]